MYKIYDIAKSKVYSHKRRRQKLLFIINYHFTSIYKISHLEFYGTWPHYEVLNTNHRKILNSIRRRLDVHCNGIAKTSSSSSKQRRPGYRTYVFPVIKTFFSLRFRSNNETILVLLIINLINSTSNCVWIYDCSCSQKRAYDFHVQRTPQVCARGVQGMSAILAYPANRLLFYEAHE